MRILVVAPHADDESLGVGGTIARLASNGHEVWVAVMTGAGEDPHPLWSTEVWDVVRAEAAQACDVLGVKKLVFREIPAVLVPDWPQWRVNKEALEVLNAATPDVLFVPFPYDLHRDHREIYYSYSVAWRPTTEVGRGIRAIYAYETVSETHWNPPYLEPGFLPTTYVDISEHLETKLAALDCYKSQIEPPPSYRSLEAIQAQATWRGAQAGMHAAEAFVAIREYHGIGGSWMDRY